MMNNFMYNNNNFNNQNNNQNNQNNNQNIQQFKLNNFSDDTPTILLEQLAYIDTFMPQLEEDINHNQDKKDINFLNNNNNFDFISNSLDDRLAEELKIFADESFIFPDEDKPENPDLNLNNQTMPNYNNNSNNLLSDNNQKNHKKDLRNKYLKTSIGNDDNKAFLKRHDYHQNDNMASTYTPSMNSFQSSNSFIQSPLQNTLHSTTEPDQGINLSEYHTNSLYTMLPKAQHDRYIHILSDLQKLQGRENFINEWTLNFSLEEVALLLVFKEYYLPQLPVSMIQYDQFQDPDVIERELYKVLNMKLKDDMENNVHDQSKSIGNKRKGSVIDGSNSDNSDKSRKSSLIEEDLETQVKKLIKISEKLQKKVTSLEVENKMLRNLVSKDNK
ncbi:uncharacterized protein HGUI_00368 [Hanseniaspora guilliermondii]|uniref:BZIP domain-containing protein n=1 Tax=Hanseniaspora guilliermondii TaxID=56406 RepID=A0A1L0AVM1_9ASCO|nr:uncharacterized protein HGUI_00368 [Hanseniaspora guilliermondii]